MHCNSKHCRNITARYREYLRERIAKKVEEVRYEVTDEMYNTVKDSLKPYFENTRANYLDSAESGKYPDGYDIVNFINKLQDAIESFIINNQ